MTECCTSSFAALLFF